MEIEDDELPAAPRRRWRRLVAGGLVLLALLGVVRWRAGQRFHPARAPEGRALGIELPVMMAALVQARSPGQADQLVERMKNTALTPAVRQTLGPEGASKLEATLAAAREVVLQPGAAGGPATQGYLNAAGALGQALLDRNLPYFLDGDVHPAGSRPQPILLSFYIERDAEVRVGDLPVRALHVRRLDPLNLSQAALGYTRPTTPAALVLLDQIEAELVLYVLPALPAGEPMMLVDEESLDADEAWQRELHEGAARVVRETFAAAGEDTAPVRELGATLARRRALIAKWRRSIAALRMKLVVPERLIPEADLRSELDRLVPRSELIEWDEMHDRLASREIDAVFSGMRDRFAAVVERHEVQHRVDHGTGLAPLPEDVRQWLLLDDGGPGDFQGFGARVRLETSAYLAALASSRRGGRLDLVLTSRFLFHKQMQGNAYSYAGLVILSELARELGVTPPAPLIARRHIARPAAAAVLLKCMEQPDEKIQAAAGAAWARLFGRPLPEARAVSSRQHEPWRR